MGNLCSGIGLQIDILGVAFPRILNSNPLSLVDKPRMVGGLD